MAASAPDQPPNVEIIGTLSSVNIWMQHRARFALLAGLLVVSLLASGWFDRELPELNREESTALRTTDGTLTHPKSPNTALSSEILLEPNKSIDAAINNPTRQPRVAWFLSFGGSGTSYTIMNTERITNTTTATNYAADLHTLKPVHPELVNGPFVHDINKNMPETWILTKTHCGGYCMDCPPAAYVHTLETFERSCRTGQIGTLSQDRKSVIYHGSVPQKVLHLIRDPLDNIVGRLHLAVKNKQKRNVETEPLVRDWTNDAAGLTAWCRYLDNRYQAVETVSSAIAPYLNIPCHAEWFRYIQWHNLAYQVAQQANLPVQYLYYEDYSTNFNASVQLVLDFLNLPKVNDPFLFVPGKTYAGMFAKEHVEMATAMVQELAIPKVWELIHHYFDDYFARTTSPNEPSSSTSVVTNTKRSPGRPYVAWLMSFPNSGTSYTIRNTEYISDALTATNYAAGFDVVQTVRPDLVGGPYLHTTQNLPLPASYILTKTHCAGYCDECAPSFYVETVNSFAQGCCRGEFSNTTVSNQKVVTWYNTSDVRKVIHLVRSPFDNLVARIHLAVKRRKRHALGWSTTQIASLTSDRVGYLNWCSYIDATNAETTEQTNLLSDEMKRLFATVPCAAEWYRYVQWHNLALATTRQAAIPVQVLYYENYTTAYNETVQEIFDFLEQPMIKEPVPFYPGKTYMDFYSTNEVVAITSLVRAMATAECWQLIQHYFKAEQHY